jgi:thymidylate synthase
MVETYKNVYEFIAKKSKELLAEGNVVHSTNNVNEGTLKEELVELPHQFFVIEDPAATAFNLPSFRTLPSWMVGEVLTEFLNLNPPVMTKYRQDIIAKSYDLTPCGTAEYMYGSRWMEFNQIPNAIKRLQQNPNSKRVLIQTWAPYDMDEHRKDVPCNINYMFLGRNGVLDMTSTIRSNDIMRGTRYDYFLAGFMLQSMASWAGMQPGKLYFNINSLHAYREDFGKLEKILEEVESGKHEITRLEIPNPLTVEKYWHDLRHVKKAEEASYNGAWDYFEKNLGDMHTPFFRDFGRIYGVQNATTYKRPDLAEKYKHELEDYGIRKWMKVDKQQE